MGAWILAWVDRSAWRDPIAADPAAAEQLGEALKALPFVQHRLDGFGKLQVDYEDIGRRDADYVGSHETRLVVGPTVNWSNGPPARGATSPTFWPSDRAAAFQVRSLFWNRLGRRR